MLETQPAANPHGITGPRDISAVKMLRISVTDVCNLRCVYCMPEEGVEWLPKSSILTYEEIATVVRASAGLGITHFKLTGGEPTARRDLPVLIDMLRLVPGVEDLSLTTNGILLAPMLERLRDAGLSRITISLDSLRPERFAAITRGGNFAKVWNSIEKAIALNFARIKLNVVVMRGLNDDEPADFAALTRDLPITVRFIEFMPLGRSGLTDAPEAAMVTEADIRQHIRAVHGDLLPADRRSETGVGPANVWQLPGNTKGRIGFISAMSHPFCDTCNRLRMTPEGLMRSCLFDGGEVDLKPILRRTTTFSGLDCGPASSTPTVREGQAGASDLTSLESQIQRAMTSCVTFKTRDPLLPWQQGDEQNWRLNVTLPQSDTHLPYRPGDPSPQWIQWHLPLAWFSVALGAAGVAAAITLQCLVVGALSRPETVDILAWSSLPQWLGSAGALIGVCAGLRPEQRLSPGRASLLAITGLVFCLIAIAAGLLQREIV